MKLIKNLLILTMLILLNSCSQDFMSPDSPSTFDPKFIFGSIEDSRKATNSCYVNFGDDGYSSRMCIWMQNLTDESEMAGSVGATGKTNYNIMALDAEPLNGALEQAWVSGYRAIKNCNVVIEGIKASPLYESTDPIINKEMHQYIGEAYTIRALWYSMMVNAWGDIPFVTQSPATPGVDFDLPRTDRNVILSSVIDDLIQAEESMKWADEVPQSIQQVTRGYTLGLIAKISLQRAGYYLGKGFVKQVATPEDRVKYYTIARDYCQKLMTLKGRELPADFAQVFKNECQQIYPTNGDVLFEIPFASGANGTGIVGYNIGMSISSTAGIGAGGHDMKFTMNYFYSFDTKDKRRDQTVGLYDIDGFGNHRFIGNNNNALNTAQKKWSKEYCEPKLLPTNTKGTGINWPLMRYADVLLMFAEAENELNNGPTGAAKNALAKVRQRAFASADWPTKVDAYIASKSDKTSFFNAIVDERFWEFGGEMMRKFDLIRWGNYEEKMQGSIANMRAIFNYNFANKAIQTTATNYSNWAYWRVDNGKITIYQALFDNNNSIPTGTIVTSVPTFTTPNFTTPANTWYRSQWLDFYKPLTTGVVGGYAVFDNSNSQYLYYKDANPIKYIYPINFNFLKISTKVDNEGWWSAL